MVVDPVQRYTPVEYLEQEERAEFKSELILGVMLLIDPAPEPSSLAASLNLLNSHFQLMTFFRR